MDDDSDDDIFVDEIGRCFCKAHRREKCLDCFLTFDTLNRAMEEQAGLIKKRTPWEEAAEQKAAAYVALQKMERQNPRLPEQFFTGNRKMLQDAEEKLQRFAREGHDVETAVQKAVEAEQGRALETDAMAQAWFKENPNSTNFE